MKKNLFIKIAMLVVVLTVATACIISGTFAKYTTTVLGEDTISVARFGYQALDSDAGIPYTAGTAAIDLFENAKSDATGTVADDHLAPGVYGSFAIVLDGSDTEVDLAMTGSTVAASATGEMDTDVDAFISYDITYGVGAATTLGTPSYVGGIRATPEEFAAEVEAVLAAITLEKNTTGYIMVYWMWVDGSDAADTTLGQKWAAGVVPVLTLTVSNTATQIMTSTPDYTDDDLTNPWVVTFDGGAADAVLTSGSKYYIFANATETILTPPVYTRDDYTLNPVWSPAVPVGATTITADAVYTAQWTEI